MKSSFDIFLSMLRDTNIIMDLYDYLDNEVRIPVDYSDLLRWQWVQGVSALDKFIHDIVRIGMLEIYRGIRQPTKKYLDFKIDINTHVQMSQNQVAAISLFEQKIVSVHKQHSFQDPDNISDALSNIWNENYKWQVISNLMQIPESDVKIKLKNISIRRNQIVHEGDYSNVLQRQEIIKEDVIEVIGFIEKLGNSVFNLVTRNS